MIGKRAGSPAALAVVLALVAVLPLGCTGMPDSSAGQAARAQLCNDSDPTGLAAIATQLDDVDGADATALQTALGTVLANLQSLSLQPADRALRDAAATAVQQLQGLLSDPDTRREAARLAARALRLLHTEICQ